MLRRTESAPMTPSKSCEKARNSSRELRRDFAVGPVTSCMVSVLYRTTSPAIEKVWRRREDLGV